MATKKYTGLIILFENGQVSFEKNNSKKDYDLPKEFTSVDEAYKKTREFINNLKSKRKKTNDNKFIASCYTLNEDGERY